MDRVASLCIGDAGDTGHPRPARVLRESRGRADPRRISLLLPASHLSWDREAGLGRFVADANMLFRRNALAFEITPAGEARRLLPAPLADTIGWMLFQTGDAETDRLLEAARRRILSPKPEDRQDGWKSFGTRSSD